MASSRFFSVLLKENENASTRVEHVNHVLYSLTCTHAKPEDTAQLALQHYDVAALLSFVCLAFLKQNRPEVQWQTTNARMLWADPLDL